ncbi:hypothetical protein PCANC_09153 [Puccinia coronata f. sp. avenae]|uniref:Uncharacterized protein n=1 Tax=Puccinia coronata f. sp. avenae TaxID=200324 RepID=A0A2N5VV41_9BASI|nr:hypothetical protein PCANC_09153 [Puccinia coronata f. sp. avenae]
MSYGINNPDVLAVDNSQAPPPGISPTRVTGLQSVEAIEFGVMRADINQMQRLFDRLLDMMTATQSAQQAFQSQFNNRWFQQEQQQLDQHYRQHAQQPPPPPPPPPPSPPHHHFPPPTPPDPNLQHTFPLYLNAPPPN